MEIKEENDCYETAHLARDVSQKIGFSKLDSSLVMAATMEIATNALRHAGGGKVTITPLDSRGMEIVVEDSGPGIENVGYVMQDGHSSIKGSLGLGLHSAKSTMDEFSIATGKNGTKVTMRKYLPLSSKDIEYSVVSLPAAGNIENGDAYVIKECFGNSILLAVIDGEGHGLPAYKASLITKAIIEEEYLLPLKEILVHCHQALLKTSERGASIGLMRLAPGKLEYLGLGNIEAVIVPKEAALYSLEGEVGKALIPLPHTMESQKVNIGHNLTVILHSDGISPRFFISDKLSLDQNTQTIAQFIMNNFRHTADDATVLVVKWKK